MAKRVRTTGRNAWEVIHVWANQSLPRMRYRNCYFEGPTVYSYGAHFPMATFVTNAKGQRAVLVSEDK